MNFDHSWKEPTEAQIAALHHACRCIGGRVEDLPDQSLWHTLVVGEASRRAWLVEDSQHGYKLNEFDLAEMMLSAGGSLWYHQAVVWATEPMTKYGPDYEQISQMASRFVVKVVKWGYQDGKWWDLEAITPNTFARATEITTLLEFNRLTDRLIYPRGTREAVAAVLTQDAGPLVSSGWSLLPTLLVPKLSIRKVTRLLASKQEGAAAAALAEVRAYFDPEFRKELGRIKRAARKAMHNTYEPTECIHPECHNLVAPTGVEPREGHYRNYRGTGACRKGHNCYFCTKCDRPHSFASDRGQQHYPKYYGKDWDGTDMEGKKWT